jgi:hypothetical protein
MRGWKNTVVYSEKKTGAVSTRPALGRMAGWRSLYKRLPCGRSGPL